MQLHNVAYFLILLSVVQRFSASQTPFNVDEQPYSKHGENLTSIAALEDFFEIECAIYVDNVYAVYERFFYCLLFVLPRSVRRQQLKLLLQRMSTFQEVENVHQKMQLFDSFIAQYSNEFECLFEYDAAETLIGVQQFNDLYVDCGVESVLNYANAQQLHNFEYHTSVGIKHFLIVQRPRLSKAHISAFKMLVDEYLESVSFVEKRQSLKLFLRKCHEFLRN